MKIRTLAAAAIVAVALFGTAFGQESFIGRNSNAVGPTPDGFYKGIPHYQDNEAHCDRNPLLPANIVCMANGYGGADHAIGDAWPRIFETQDNARTWLSRYATGSNADSSTSLGLGFGADPIMTCFPGGCAGFFIASNRAPGGGTGGGVYMQLMPEFNIETGFRHFSEAGPRTVQLGTGTNFLDKIDAVYMIDTDNPGTVPVTMTVEKGNGVTELINRDWPRARIVVVFASINSSNQNVRIFSTYTDNYGGNWSSPKQVANTTGVDTGVAVAAMGDTVAYLYRQFQDDSGGEIDAVFAAISTTRGQTVRKPTVIVDNLCAFDQPTLPVTSNPNPPPFETVASRTNNFVDVTSDGRNFIAVLAQRIPGPDGCLTQPFNYQTGSRVFVMASSTGRNWSTPEKLAMRSGQGFPRDGHSFQIMPAVDCVLGVCQAIWYDSINDSIRNINFLESAGKHDAVDAFVNFPLFGDFYYPRVDSLGSPELIQFRRTMDVYTRRFTVGGGSSINFRDAAPVRVTSFPLIAIGPSTVVEAEQLPFNLKQYKSLTASFMSDYIGLASQKVRVVPGSDPTAPPQYEPNNGTVSGPLAGLLKPSWFAHWTDTRNARGQLYTQHIGDSLPFEKTAAGGLGARIETTEPDESEPPVPLREGRKLSAEGVEDSDHTIPVAFCSPAASPPSQPGDILFYVDNRNRIKDADIYGALIEEPATAWVLNSSKGLGQFIPDPDSPGDFFPLQRTYALAARNELDDADKKFRFRIMNQPVGFLTNEARASWLQLPYKNFDNSDPLQAPLEEVEETAGRQSSVTVALFVVSEQLINPVTVNVYEVDGTTETLVETLTVNGALHAGELITPFAFLPDVNEIETHNPFVYSPTNSVDIENPEVWNPEVWNPEVWNPEVWNPEVWNPEVWNPEVWNPEVWNPEVWNPEVWNSDIANPEVWNPEVWNTGVEDADDLDNPEIPSPDVSQLRNAMGDLRQPGELVAKFDVQFAARNDGNTLTPYTADFAVNSTLVRQLLLEQKVTAQIIVWEDHKLNSYQGCAPDPTAGENRILAVADIATDDEASLLVLKIPDILNNRFGSVTYYLESLGTVYFTIRFTAFEAVIRQIAPELIDNGISYVVTSQAANTHDVSLNPGLEQAIENNVPPLLTVNSADFPVELVAIRNALGEVGAILPSGLITVIPADEFEPPPTVACESVSLTGPVLLGEFAALGLGNTILICSATGENLVTGSIEFEVDVVDDDPPVLGALPADLLLERQSLDGAIAGFTLPTATDDIDSNVAVACSTPAAGGGTTPFSSGSTAAFVPPGPTQTDVTCVATDDSGNTDSGMFTATVQDSTAPVIAATSDILVGAVTVAGATVNFSTPTATDVGNVTVSCDAISGTTFALGATTVTCTATDDAGLTTIDQFQITVVDMIPPMFTPAADFSVQADTAGGANVLFTAPTATDFGQPVDVTCTAFVPPQLLEPGDFFLFPIGVTTVTCTAIDGSGNIATDAFDITVVDTTAPTITVPGDITVTLDSASGAVVDYTVTAMDTADLNVVIDCDSPSGSVFPIGDTTVNCSATDASGNSASDSFTVTVELGEGFGIRSKKKSVNSGAVAQFTWAWLDSSNNPVDTGEENNDIEARLGECESDSPDILNEDPGSSDIRQQSDNTIIFNWQTVDDSGSPIEPAGIYCVSAVLTTTGQSMSTEIKVR